jgi:branched-chain amino acid transport system substrate-binding protein
MRILEIRRVLRCFAAIALTLFFAESSAAGAAEGPVEVPVILSLTGNGGFVGKSELTGVRGVEAAVNKTGGIGGRPLKFVVSDDATNPEVAIQLFNAALTKKPNVIIGTSIAAGCNAIAALVKQGPVAYCLSTGVHPQPGSYEFSTITSVYDHVQALVRYFRLRGVRRVAIIASTDASGQDGESGFDQALSLPENASMKMVAREHFAVTDLTVAAQLARIKAADPQVLVAMAIGPAAGTLFRSTTEAGFTIPVIASAATLVYAQMKQYSAFLPKELYFAGCAVYAQDQVRDAGMKKSLSTFDSEVTALGDRPELLQAAGWDPAMLVVTALRKLGPDASAEQVRAYLSSVSGFAGAYGRYDFRAYPQRGVGASNVIVVRWDSQKDGWVGVSKPGGEPL